MPPTPAPYRASISIVGGLSRCLPADHPRVIAARQEMQTQKLVLHIQSVLNEGPPLTREQRTRLADLLLAGCR